LNQFPRECTPGENDVGVNSWGRTGLYLSYDLVLSSSLGRILHLRILIKHVFFSVEMTWLVSIRVIHMRFLVADVIIMGEHGVKHQSSKSTHSTYRPDTNGLLAGASRV